MAVGRGGCIGSGADGGVFAVNRGGAACGGGDAGETLGNGGGADEACLLRTGGCICGGTPPNIGGLLGSGDPLNGGGSCILV